MSRKFCDSLLTTGANDGSTMDDAYQSIETALEAALTAGDKLYTRRRSGFWNPSSNIAPSADGNLANPIQAIGCPRNVKTGTGIFVQGSNVISGVSFVPKLEQHGTRMIKNDADGREYMISAIAHKIDYDNKSGDFTEGLMVIGAGGCEGKIHKVIDNGDGTGSLWIVSKARELIDRGNCEDPIAPMIFHEITPFLWNATWSRDETQKHDGNYSYKITKTVASGTAALVIAADNNSTVDMHGFIANRTYTFEAWVKVLSASGIALNEVFLNLVDYVGDFQETQSNNPTAFDTWQKLTVTRTIRSAAVAANSRINMGSTAELNEYYNVDDVSLKNVFLDNEQITDEDTGVADVDGTPADDGFVILNNYAGVTDTGALTIEKDEDYDDFQLINDSTWTIKKIDWNGDVDDLPIVDFGASAYIYHQHLAYAWIMKNITWKGSTAPGIMKTQTLLETSFKHNLFIQLSTATFIRMYGLYSEKLVLENCIFFGSGSSHGLQGIYPHDQYLKNCAVYNCGYGMLFYNDWKMENVNCGIELPNSNYDMYKYGGVNTEITNLRVGGKNGGIVLHTGMPFPTVYIENYNSFGVYEKRYLNGQMIKKDVLLGSGDPYRRSNGAESVIEISCGVHIVYAPIPDEWKYLVFEHEFEMDAASRNYRYCVQCKAMSIVNVGELFLEVEYVDQYVSDSVYHMKKVKSDELIAERTGADDWSQYLEVIGIEPAVASKVRIRCYLGKYDADGRIFIDPKPSIT